MLEINDDLCWQTSGAESLRRIWVGGRIIIEADGPIDDMPWNTLNQPVVSERFVDAVGDLIAEDVEFLPIDAFIGGWTRKDRWSPVSEIRIDGPADRAFFVLTALRTVRLPVTIYGYPVVQDLRPVVPEGLHLFRNEVFRVALLCRHTIRERCEERGVTGVQYHPLWESGETTWRDQS